MSQPAPQFSIVLIGRYPGKDVSVAQALSRCMGREEGWGLRVVSSAPIIVFENLAEKQSAHLLKALADVAGAGCKFEIESGANASYPKVGWAQPPKINGRDLHEFATGEMPAVESKTPPPLTRHSGSVSIGSLQLPASLPAAKEKEPVPESASATLVLPCPYTGQPMKLVLHVAVSKFAGTTRLALGAEASVGNLNQASSISNSQTGTIILPAIAEKRRATDFNSIDSKKTGPLTVPYPQPSSDTGVNLRDKNAMLTTTVARPMSSDHALPALSWRRKTPHEVPLPDVPVLPSQSRPGTAKKSARAEQNNLPLDSKPMDLSDFEEQLGVSPHDSVRPFVDAGPYNLTDSSDQLALLSEDNMAGGETLCSVFIERSSSPVVHQLVAELHGIPEGEASEMCVSGSVALAENIPLEEAQDIQRRCAEINVAARIVKQ